MFSIDFEADEADTEESRIGVITLGGVRESFQSLQSFWDVHAYRRHWGAALERIARGENSCLLTSLAHPGASHLLFWWLAYPEQKVAYFQNGILLFDELTEKFDPQDPFRFVPPRVTINEDGERVLEWRVSKSDIDAFLVQRPAGF